MKIIYQLVRDAIADLIGQFAQDVAEAFFSFGTALPAIAAQISAAVSKWVSKITSKGKVVLQGFQKGKELLNSLKATLSKASPIMEKLSMRRIRLDRPEVLLRRRRPVSLLMHRRRQNRTCQKRQLV